MPRSVLFLAAVIIVYLILFVAMPDKASDALGSSIDVALRILLPLGVAFIAMVVLNLFVKPSQVVRFLGRGAGAKGVLLSTVAGIISMGPIYAWYPLLKELREKGAGNSHLAIFLGNRAVKPFLLLVMIAYFGWAFVVILTVFTVVESLIVGWCVGAFAKGENRLPS